MRYLLSEFRKREKTSDRRGMNLFSPCFFSQAADVVEWVIERRGEEGSSRLTYLQ